MLTMYDTAGDGSAIPANPQAVAGYLDGGNFNQLVARFPHAHHLGIATHGQVDGDCLDVENGDASPADVLPWVKRMQAQGRYRPCVYSSLSNGMVAVKTALASLPRSSYRLWVAHWTPGSPPSSVPAGYDGVQWLPVAFRYDESLLLDSFFAPKPPPTRPTLTAAQKKSLDAVRQDLIGIVAQKGQLTKTEYDQLVLAHSRIAGVLGVK